MTVYSPGSAEPARLRLGFGCGDVCPQFVVTLLGALTRWRRVLAMAVIRGMA